MGAWQARGAHVIPIGRSRLGLGHLLAYYLDSTLCLLHLYYTLLTTLEHLFAYYRDSTLCLLHLTYYTWTPDCLLLRQHTLLTTPCLSHLDTCLLTAETAHFAVYSWSKFFLQTDGRRTDLKIPLGASFCFHHSTEGSTPEQWGMPHNPWPKIIRVNKERLWAGNGHQGSARPWARYPAVSDPVLVEQGSGRQGHRWALAFCLLPVPPCKVGE